MEIIFVYNASLSPVSLLKDLAAEIIPGREAECKLCDITYSLAFKKNAWKSYTSKLPFPSRFMLKDRFEKQFGKRNMPFPNAWINRNGEPEVFITSDEFNALEDVYALMDLVDGKLDKMDI